MNNQHDRQPGRPHNGTLNWDEKEYKPAFSSDQLKDYPSAERLQSS